jgi:hypothetical protein
MGSFHTCLLLLLFSWMPTLIDGATFGPGRTVPSTYPKLPPATPMISATTTFSNMRGGGLIPAGYHPLGYKMTPLGEQFLAFPGSLDSDLGRFLAAIRERKTFTTIKSQWLEIVRVSKNTQSMRVYRTLQELIEFCLSVGLLD